MFPTIKPAKSKDCTSAQSEYTHCAKLPMRSIVLGPSGSGKTILLQNMILYIYKSCLSTILVTLDMLLSLLSSLGCNVGIELTMCVVSISNSKQLPHLLLQSECPQLVIRLFTGSVNAFIALSLIPIIYT